MGTPATGPEVLGQGRDLQDHADEPRRASSAARLPRGVWTVLAVLGLLAGGTWYAGRPVLDRSQAAPRPAATGAAILGPDPQGTALVSGLAEGHDLSAPKQEALDSFIASGGHVLLFLQVRNDGVEPVRILDGVVPQDGASRDLTAGGLAAGTSAGGMLGPGDSGEVFVRLGVRCPEVLAGRAASSVLLLAEQPGRHPRLERVVISSIAPYWDEARRAACTTPDPGRDVRARVTAGSLRATRNDDGTVSVSAVLQVHDAAGFAAVVTGPAVAAGGGPLVVAGGSTSAAPLRWSAGRCTQATVAAPPGAPTYTVDLPQVSATGRVDLGPDFAAAWRSAVAAACA
jgi:hypothetical protein